MQTLHAQRETLRDEFNTNPYCRRMGAWPDELMQLVSSEAFCQLDWADARQQLVRLKPSKYCDVNIRNIAYATRDKHTLEIRTLPATLDATEIFTALDKLQALFTQVLNNPDS